MIIETPQLLHILLPDRQLNINYSVLDQQLQYIKSYYVAHVELQCRLVCDYNCKFSVIKHIGRII